MLTFYDMPEFSVSLTYLSKEQPQSTIGFLPFLFPVCMPSAIPPSSSKARTERKTFTGWLHFDKSWNRTSFTPKYCVQRKRSGGVGQRVCVCVSWTRAPNPLKRVALLTGQILNSLWYQHSCRFATQHSAANSWRIARCKRAPGKLCGSQLEIEISSTFYTAWILHQTIEAWRACWRDRYAIRYGTNILADDRISWLEDL